MKLGILFDLDGTLLATLEDLADAVNYAMQQHGCPERTIEQVRLSVGTGTKNLIRLSLPGKPEDPPLEQVHEAFLRYYAAHSQVKTRPYPGIMEALEQLKGRFPIAIVSNKRDVAVKALCNDYFPGVYALGEREGFPRKPAPDMVRLAMEEIGVDTCIYVGDSDVDVLTAQNAGVPCLSVLWGFRDKACIASAGGTHFCETPAELVSALIEMSSNIQ